MALGREPGLAGGDSCTAIPTGSKPRTPRPRLVICTATEETATTLRKGGGAFNMAWTRAHPPSRRIPHKAANGRRPSPPASPLFLYFFWGGLPLPPPLFDAWSAALFSPPPETKALGGGREGGQEGREKTNLRLKDVTRFQLSLAWILVRSWLNDWQVGSFGFKSQLGNPDIRPWCLHSPGFPRSAWQEEEQPDGFFRTASGHERCHRSGYSKRVFRKGAEFEKS